MCEDGICRDMARYPRELCQGILRGLAAQLRVDGRINERYTGVQSLYGPKRGYSGRVKDDLTRQVLRDDLVMVARAKGRGFFNSKGVWIKVPRHLSEMS